MTDDRTPPQPDPAWTLFPVRPVIASEPSPAPVRPRRRKGALLVAAVLAGGAAGGLVTSSFETSSATDRTADIVQRSSLAITQTAAVNGPAGTPESAAATIAPSVVTVEVSGTQTSNSPIGGTQAAPVSDTGSGVVLRSDGYVLTNNHVVAAAETGGSVHITLSDGRTVAATIVGHDATDDLAVLRATGVSGLTSAVFAPSSHLRVGQAVLAVGAPLGLANTVTQGIVSTLHRPVATGEAGASAQSVIDALQTDAAINPGNSGGALVDLAGRVVGINSAIASTGSSGSGQAGNIGVGFAIPSDDAARVADQLIVSGHATHAQLGTTAGDAASATDGAPGLGATIQGVTAGGPAARAGLQPGDVVTKLGDRVVTEANGLIVAVRSHQPGSVVAISYLRDGAVHTAGATLASAPSD